MPDEPRRVVLEKSRTVRRRYQRSNKPFQFTASQLQRIEREQERERRAKQIRDKEKKRTANKKRKAEQEARAREERKRRGIPDPGAPSVPSSQPLLSNFLGLEKRPAPVAAEPLPTETGDQGDGGDTEPDSEAGDTEVDDDTCDNVEENLGQEISGLQDAGVPENSKSPDSTRKNQCVPKDDDEFSDCSAFNDEDIMKEAEAAATSQPLHETTNHPTPRPSSFLQPPSNSRPKGMASAVVSFGDSFRDETADLLEEAFTGVLAEESVRRSGMDIRPVRIAHCMHSGIEVERDVRREAHPTGQSGSFGLGCSMDEAHQRHTRIGNDDT